jgi:isopentenyldiphosphate isomerase
MQVFVTTYSVAAAVNSELGSENDTSDKCEKSSERVHSKERNWDRQTFHESCNSSINQDQPAEDTGEDSIVDARWVSSESFSNDVSDQSCCEESP